MGFALFFYCVTVKTICKTKTILEVCRDHVVEISLKLEARKAATRLGLKRRTVAVPN